MKVSIVIPNYNGQKLLAKNLPLVINAVGKDEEIIVVDDASTDESVSLMHKEFPRVKVIQHEINKRFGVSCNTGIKAASGDIIILLNSDVVPQKGFIQPLTKHFKDTAVFSVGCKEIEIIHGIEIISGRTEGKFDRGMLVHWHPDDQESQDTLWTFGGSMAVDRKKFMQLGGFDKLYSPAYWEDIDLCFRAKQKGWKVLFEKNAKVYHEHETTNLTVFGKRRIEIMSYRNQLIFIWKNIRGIQLIKHLLWLPYHLIFTSIRSKGAFVLAFWLAVWRWFEYKIRNSKHEMPNNK